MRRLYPVVLVLATLLLSGCLEVENEFTLNPDGSGKVRHHVLVSSRSFKPGRSGAIKEQEATEEQLKKMVREEIQKSSGVDAWRDLSYEITDDGMCSFTGTAYFKDLSELTFHNSGFSGSLLAFSLERSDDGTISVETPPKREQLNRKESSGNRTEKQIQKKIKNQRAKFQRMKTMKKMSSMKNMRFRNRFHLPAAVQSVSNVEKVSANQVRLSITGKDLFEAIDAVLFDDALMRKMVKQGKGLKHSLPEDMTKNVFNKKLFGEKGPVRFTMNTGGTAQFDYEREVRQARKEQKEALKKPGIDVNASGTSATGNEKEDGDGELSLAGLEGSWTGKWHSTKYDETGDLSVRFRKKDEKTLNLSIDGDDTEMIPPLLRLEKTRKNRFETSIIRSAMTFVLTLKPGQSKFTVRINSFVGTEVFESTGQIKGNKMTGSYSETQSKWNDRGTFTLSRND